jgi:hypothetical protein
MQAQTILPALAFCALKDLRTAASVYLQEIISNQREARVLLGATTEGAERRNPEPRRRHLTLLPWWGTGTVRRDSFPQT